jgi:hypothetical protein
MGTAIDQFKTGRPLWWVVNGAVVVPVWAVELVKRRGQGRLVAHDEELVA